MTQRTPFVAGNWKMNMGADDATAFSERLVAEDPPDGVDVVICPPFVSLPATAMILSGSPVALGAQNAHWETSGAHFYAWEQPLLFFTVDIFACKSFDVERVVEFTRDFFSAPDLVAKEV